MVDFPAHCNTQRWHNLLSNLLGLGLGLELELLQGLQEDHKSLGEPRQHPT